MDWAWHHSINQHLSLLFKIWNRSTRKFLFAMTKSSTIFFPKKLSFSVKENYSCGFFWYTFICQVSLEVLNSLTLFRHLTPVLDKHQILYLPSNNMPLFAYTVRQVNIWTTEDLIPAQPIIIFKFDGDVSCGSMNTFMIITGVAQSLT